MCFFKEVNIHYRCKIVILYIQTMCMLSPKRLVKNILGTKFNTVSVSDNKCNKNTCTSVLQASEQVNLCQIMLTMFSQSQFYANENIMAILQPIELFIISQVKINLIPL